jgi:hypothetical protein
MTDFEGLGVFYLGKPLDAVTGKPADSPLLYESKDLVTHAVCVGMTGSGKTGLCIGLLEEAAIDGIPAIVIDPKGDLANLLLTFPELRPEDFRPWINEDEARIKGVGADEFATQQAELWKKGLASYGQDGARIQRLRDAVEFTIFTPGSDAGVPVSVLKSFDAPDASMAADKELFRDRISATATSLLGLLGIDADPIKSREHVLLSNILDTAWRDGKNLDLPGIIAQIQAPPFQKAGVMDLETFYPAKERFSLAMALNNLLASPGFQSWLEGEPLDIGRLLHTREGKPRLSILSIAHLSEAERMFFVSLLLNQVLGWVRSQPGTTSLRALLYMDEIAGYFPPVANPPSKKPLLTLLKQARAYGLGIVLATQNPVDLDYKGLSNTGTWFIGRLQTERDKMRVLEGLEGAAGEAHAVFDRQKMEQTLAGLGNRTFLLNNVHESGPVLFQTRWTLSYLRGPMTRDQIRTLVSGQQKPGPAETSPSAEPARQAKAITSGAAPVLPPDIPQYFVPVASTGRITYRPVLIGAAKLRYLDDKQKLDEIQNRVVLAPFSDGAAAIDWTKARLTDLGIDELEKEPEEGSQFEDLPGSAAKAKSYEAWKRSFVTWLFQEQKLELLESPSLGQRSKPGESERDFRIRLQQTAREEVDREAATLRQKYAPKLASLEDRKRKAELAAGQQKSQQGQAMLQTAVSVGAGLLSAFLGRKAVSVTSLNKVATAARQAGRTWKETQDVHQATENVEQLSQQAVDLQHQLETELAALQAKIDPATEKFETVCVRLKKANIEVQLVALGWASGT